MTDMQPIDIQVLNPATYAAGDPATNGLRWDQYEWLRSNAPCDRQKPGSELLVPEAWVVSRDNDVVAIDRDERRFSSEEGAILRLVDMTTRRNSDRPGMSSIDGPDHIRNRRVASRGLSQT
jgi:cytochrome P450